MRISILTILTVILAECAVLGQTVLPPVFEIKSDTALGEKIDTVYCRMLGDKEGKWTIQNVTTMPLSDKFHYLKESASIDTIANVYWFRYRLKNTMSREARISLNASTKFDDFYLLESDGKWKHYQTGLDIAWVEKDGLKRTNCIPLVLQTGEERVVYLRIKSKNVGGSKFVISILGTDKIVKQFYLDYVNAGTDHFSMTHLQVAFLEGLLFLALFFNLFFFRIVREKVYLYFALFVLFLFLDRSNLLLYEYCLVEHPHILEYLNYLTYSWAIIPYFLIQFFRHFFQIKVRYPRWDKYLLGLAILNFILFVATVVSVKYLAANPQIFAFTLYIVFLFIIPSSLIVMLLLYVRNRERSVRYLIIGSFPYMIFDISNFPNKVVEFFQIQAKLPLWYNMLMANFAILQIICLAWLVLCSTWILFMRYDRLIKENAQQALDKERLAKEQEKEKNELIELQKTELEHQVTERTADLKQSLENLKSTQSQLIQSEKMASLGELTAGIAHEIQNPLNFVNNFSEVNTELIEEMKTELKAGNQEDAIALANDIAENEKKINMHGKRADSIVKGMLQHSRSSSGVKEPTDINKLTDEFLRLSYHGLRAKDKTFNASMKTDFDPAIGKINVVSEEIGRVILNLLNNAFYAVTEKKRLNPEGYEPTVSVSTQKIEDIVEIKVLDNGNGIPQKVLDKIFQPFFTTKPAGQGTGLGLSLAYDIVKAHGGELKVETKEGEGSEFVVQLFRTN